MKTMIRSGLMLFGASIVGMFLLQMAELRQAELAAADQPLRLKKAAPQPARARLPATPVAIEETQILLRTTIFELNQAKMATLGIDLKTARAESSPSLEAVHPQASQWQVVGQRDARQFANSLVDNEMAKVLAEPVMATTTGRPARYNGGGKVAISVPDGEGATKTVFRQIGTSLEVMPTRLPDGAVRLEMQLDHAELDHSNGVDMNGVKIPALNRRQMQTAVELQPGKTAMLRSQQLLVMVTEELVAPLAKNDNPPRRRGASSEMVHLTDPQMSVTTPRPMPEVGPTSITLTAVIYTFNSKTLQAGGVDVHKAVQEFEGVADVFIGAAEGEHDDQLLVLLTPVNTARHGPAQAPASLPAQAPRTEPDKRHSAEAKLEVLKTYFGPNHPRVLRQRQELDSLNQQRVNDTPQDVQPLRDELRELRQEMKKLRRDVRRLIELRQERAEKTGS